MPALSSGSTKAKVLVSSHPDASGEDLFAHFWEVRGDGFEPLAENQKVSYETKRGPKGLQAANISLP
jgi:cold shock CspA family protein